MISVRFRIFQVGLMLATAMSVSIGSTASHAYTPDQQQLCSGDAFRLCSSEIPDVDRVTACMVAKRSQLSPGCRVFFRSSKPVLRPVTLRKPHKARKPAKARSHKMRKQRRAT